MKRCIYRMALSGLISLCFNINLSAQIVITGTIQDFETGNPLHGANIRSVDGFSGISSDENGSFKLEVQGTAPWEITASYVGYRDTFLILHYNSPLIIQMHKKTGELQTVFITANRHPISSKNIPARTAVVSEQTIRESPVLNTDELLLMIPGIHTDRDQGVFSRNAGVTMRGMNSTARVLVLVNGASINKADGGGINWNRINPELIERIEILKGPSSAIYGGNAMAGVINIITAKPKDKLAITSKMFYGTFNTIGASTILSGSQIKNGKGFYWTFHNYLKKGSGYYAAPEELQTPYDTTNFISEIGFTATMGYAFSEKSELELELSYWDDVRSDGIQVYEELGSYNKYTTDFARIRYGKRYPNGELTAQFSYQYEHYFRQSESVGRTNGKFRLYDTDSHRKDFGGVISRQYWIGDSFLFTVGCDVKSGNVQSDEIYYTSTDLTHKKGTMHQLAPFVMVDRKIFNEKLILSGGIRYDYVLFRNGEFNIEDPSALTSFINDYPIVFSDQNWGAFSPKFGIKYRPSELFSTYALYSSGFRPAMLDDMCVSRSVSKGFKIANPNLKPETIQNFEVGVDWNIKNKLIIETSFYNSFGHGFHYFVATGDSVDTGGDSPKAVLLRDNIASVTILGTEIMLRYVMNDHLSFFSAYAYSHSVISEFSNDTYENKDLEGKYIMEVPPHQFSAAGFYRNKWIQSSVTFTFCDKQWYDDENTLFTPAYHYWNFRISSRAIKNTEIGISIHDLFDQQYLNNKGYLSTGRYLMFSIQYFFKQKKI